MNSDVNIGSKQGSYMDYSEICKLKKQVEKKKSKTKSKYKNKKNNKLNLIHSYLY